MKIIVLLSTYNGERYLREQLDSILAQELSDGVDLSILVRDDGSSDSTTKILEDYRERANLNWYCGTNLKSAKSFWDLVKNCSNADYYAFCDQDDCWFPNKISRAIKKLTERENQEQPLLYCSNVMVTDQNLNPIGQMITGEGYTDFAHSLIYSLAPGCTMVFNHCARTELLKYDMEHDFEIIHDWLAHKIIAMLGTVIYDDEPTMYYRQHGNNVIGVQKKGLVGLIKKIKKFLLGSSRSVRSENAKSILSVYRDKINDSTIDLLTTVGYYKNDKKLKRKFLRNKQFKTKNSNYFCLKWLIRFNKV